MEAVMRNDCLSGPLSVSFPSSYPTSCVDQSVTINDDGLVSINRRESETYVAVKGQSLIVTKKEGQKRGLCRRPSAVALSGSLPIKETTSNPELRMLDQHMDNPSEGFSELEPNMSEIERHLHQMTQILRPEDSIKLVVKLESVIESYVRYLAVVSCMEQDLEEFCLLGIDCQNMISLGLVLPILSHSTIRLDGDGGFCVTYADGLRSHIFKPVSVQTMWSALQSLYQASECAKKSNSYQVTAVKHYESLLQTMKSDQNCLNEWNALPGVENKRPSKLTVSSDELSFQEKISNTLREILVSEKDLDEVTSKEIRTKLEHKLQTDLSNYRSFIDEEMLKILGQMEAPAKICKHLFLGTEWNASHEQELFEKEIGYILNVTAEIDNFFPDTFQYLNIPVRDNEETDLLRYFNDSNRFINAAKDEGKNVLVHCKMGISRSATIVIAYVMKTSEWGLRRSIEHVKKKRNCVKPNPNFMKQLEVYEGILKAKKNKSTLEKRSKSESNLKRNNSLCVPKTKSKLSASNDSVSNDTPVKKSPRKYYNTAPARLKPEKGQKGFLKPKSSSLVAISNGNKTTNPPPSHVVPQDVIDSFQSAVDSLELASVASSQPSESILEGERKVNSMPVPVHTVPPLPPTCQSEQMSFSLPERSEPSRPNSIPLFSGSHSMFLSPAKEQDELDMQSSSHQGESSTAPSELPLLDPSIKLWEDGSSPPSGANQSTTVEPHTPLVEKTTKKVNIKCLGHPFNGHTFSVSPNQVVNISAGKFSVRHLVNEFELHSSRSSMSSLGGGATENNTLNLANATMGAFEGGHSRSKSWTKRESESSGSDNNMMHDGNNSSSDSNQSDGEKDEVTVNEVSIAEEQVQPHESPLLIPVVEKVVTEQRKKPEKFAWAPFFRRNSSTTNSSSVPSGSTGNTGSNNHSSSSKSSIGNLFTGWHSHKKVGEAPSESKSKKGKKSITENHTTTVLCDSSKEVEPKAKVLESFKCSETSKEDIQDLNVDETAPTGNIHSAAYQSTGVVRQRLEAFEAKKVPNSELATTVVSTSTPVNSVAKSHSRSHSTGLSVGGQPIVVPCSNSVDEPVTSRSSGSSEHDETAFIGLGHQRKSSMPVMSCIGSENILCGEMESGVSPTSFTSGAPTNGPHLRLPSTFLTSRKGSLDSNVMFKTLPKTRNFTVRGLQPPSGSNNASRCSTLGSSSGPKSLFSSGTVKMVRPPTSGTSSLSDTVSGSCSGSSNNSNNDPCLTSGGTGDSSPPATFPIRQEHGSTHPLKFLPKTSKCT